tara:strand:- start:331 stop:4614 length:4284 start_codon:yes stop_codon:yes gene_type:complete
MATICLNMIVKNESHIIKKTLTNIIKYVRLDYWVICDTGSTDNTVNIITSFFNELNIPGEIHNHEWKDFAHNRNLSLDLAYGKSDYLFIFDADDEIHGSFKIPSLTKDSYMVLFGGGYSYKRTSIINNRKKWKYFGVLHEVIVGQEEMTESMVITGEYHFVSGRTGSRNMNINKYTEDAQLLEDTFYKTDEQWLKNRYAFYCAQSYKDAKMFDKAIEWYKKTISLECWNQEQFYASYMIGVMEQRGNNVMDAIHYYLLTLKYDPRRWEGIYFAIQHYLTSNQENLAGILINGLDLTNTINPRDGNSLFINESIHDYKMYISIILLSYKCNNIEQGRRAQFKLYENFDHIPEAIAKDTIYNSQFFIPNDKTIQKYLDKTFEFIQKYTYKYKGIMPDISILNEYIKKYNKIFDYSGEYRPTQQTKVNIILTMTSCKRPQLLRRTIKSMTRCWSDFCMVDKIVCIDDGTEKNELNIIMGEFPWIEFILKDKEIIGHRSSMNMIHDIVLNSGAQYWIHIEEDWEFIKSDNYIARGIDYLTKYSSLGVKQILFNKGYAEIITDIVWKCGITLEKGLLLHNHDANDAPCGYWPNYSFRPGITSVDILKKLGDFNSPNVFFEYDYANKYTEHGFKTAYFDEITCIHIGKLAGKRGNITEQNSYEMNDILQGVVKNNKDTLPIKIINLKRRNDRRERMKNILKGVDYNFKDAVDGRLLKSNDPRLYSFIGNDFNNNPGTIGCAITHIELWQELMEETSTNYYIIMEDDISLRNDWYEQLMNINSTMNNTDIMMLGYSMFSGVREKVKTEYDNNKNIEVCELNNDNYIGGFFCYSINKIGAQKILHSLSITGIKHGIDYLVSKKISGLIKKEIRPQLAFTEWNEGGKEIDTDIQNSNESLLIDNVIIKKNEIVCFIHSCYIEQCGLSRLHNLINRLIESGLYEKLDCIYICNIGNIIDINKLKNDKLNYDNVCYNKIIIYNLSSDTNEYEPITLNMIHLYSKVNIHTKILYLHTKGLFTLDNSYVNDWINYMLYFTVDEYNTCINELKNVDCVGVNWLNNHFSGNFWWANAQHISKRKTINSINKDLTHKMKAEYFLSDPAKHYENKDGKQYFKTDNGSVIVSLHQSNLNHFHNLYPPELYINNVIRVKIITNYCSSYEAYNEFGKMGKQNGKWNNLQLVYEENYDYLVIINKPQDVLQFDKSKTIIFQMEPWCNDNNQWGVNTWGEWAVPDTTKYLAVIGRKTQTYNNVFWQLEKTYRQLQESPIKTNVISTICSSKYYDPGHKQRIDFLKYLESKNDTNFNIDIFNTDNHHNFIHYRGGVRPFIDKSKGMIHYKYYFMCENNFEPGFITEKLWEPILCESLVFYCGAPDVCKYVDPLSFVKINLDDFEKAYEIISQAIKNNLYEERLPHIRKMKERLLNEMQFFPRIEEIIKNR